MDIAFTSRTLPPTPTTTQRGRLSKSAANVIVLDESSAVRRQLCGLIKAIGASILDIEDAELAALAADRGEAEVVFCGVGEGGVLLREVAASRSHRHDTRPWDLVAIVPVSVADSVVESLDGIADDFLSMPIAMAKLRARMRHYGRSRSYLKKLEVQQETLRRYQDEAEEEQRIASHLISRMDAHDPVAARLTRAWIAPAHQLSGDVVAVARAPDDRVNLLLADGTGHGLAAAISVLPVTEVFHRMTERGFDVPTMVAEMNRKVRSFMPADRFVACVVASIDMRERHVDVWNGGCPPARLLDADGQVLRIWHSRHLALGILDGSAFDASVERVAYRAQAQVVLVSDGMSEADGFGGGQQFADVAMLEALSGPADGRLTRVVRSLNVFSGGKPLRDDASIVLGDCLLAPPADPAAVPEPGRVATPSHWLLELRLGPDQLRRLALVPFISGTLDQLGVPRHARSNLFCVLAELLNNAVDHGLLKLESSLGLGEAEHERFIQARAERMSALTSGSLWIRVAAESRDGSPFLQIEVEDSGTGFDVGSIMPPGPVGTASAGDRTNRGLALVRALCDDLRFDQDGRRVVALLPLTPAL